jgi:hypothetical protein
MLSRCCASMGVLSTFEGIYSNTNNVPGVNSALVFKLLPSYILFYTSVAVGGIESGTQWIFCILIISVRWRNLWLHLPALVVICFNATYVTPPFMDPYIITAFRVCVYLLTHETRTLYRLLSRQEIWMFGLHKQINIQTFWGKNLLCLHFRTKIMGFGRIKVPKKKLPQPYSPTKQIQRDVIHQQKNLLSPHWWTKRWHELTNKFVITDSRKKCAYLLWLLLSQKYFPLYLSTNDTSLKHIHE